jgi:hypothetical protein
MAEMRKHYRLSADALETSQVMCGGTKENVPVFNVCAGGMKVAFSRAVDVGAGLYGVVKILPKAKPFFVRGKVVRVTEKEGKWETAVHFERVSTVPFVVMNLYQMVV